MSKVKNQIGYSIPIWFVHEGNTLYLLPVQGSVMLGKKIGFPFCLLFYIISHKTENKPKDIVYSLHLYFICIDLSLRNTSKALSRFVHKRSHNAAIRVWIGFIDVNHDDSF